MEKSTKKDVQSTSEKERTNPEERAPTADKLPSKLAQAGEAQEQDKDVSTHKKKRKRKTYESFGALPDGEEEATSEESLTAETAPQAEESNSADAVLQAEESNPTDVAPQAEESNPTDAEPQSEESNPADVALQSEPEAEQSSLATVDATSEEQEFIPPTPSDIDEPPYDDIDDINNPYLESYAWGVPNRPLQFHRSVPQRQLPDTSWGPRIYDKPADQLKPHELGEEGERMAAVYLAKRGYEIIDQNWRCDFGEADIIAKDGDVYVLVEVKTRLALGNSVDILPELSVTQSKINTYHRLGLMYIAYHLAVETIRFDVIAINVISDECAKLRHLVGACTWDNPC
ncbi:MAG: YraN family protein [Atopobiaceae bacterium]|nr:YraN family protein [Atopobiaceae bacterium]